MKLELLISAVNADPKKLAEKMKVASDAVLVNQCAAEDKGSFFVENGIVRWFSCCEKGVGRSRNRAIENATGDIVLFADDDIEYANDYAKLVTDEFISHPEADALFFNVEVCEERRTYINTDFHRVHLWNGGRYPAYSIAVKREALERAGVRYSLLFGGGAKYSCGEDSIFIGDCLRAGLRMYASTVKIGREVPREDGKSTWFDGYNEKFFFDRGVMYAFLYKRLASLMGFRFVFSKRGVMCRDIPWKKAYRLLKDGIRRGREEMAGN